MTERIVIEDKQVRLETSGGQSVNVSVQQFSTSVGESVIHGLTDEPIAYNTRWHVRCGPAEVCIVQLNPELRWIKWLSPDSPVPFGPEATSVDRCLATPFVILKVPFRRGRIVSRIEVFYRNEPLSLIHGPGGALFFPNLLNVSPWSHDCTSWFCSQYLGKAMTQSGIEPGLDAVVHHLFGGSFNASSEEHEGESTFSLAGRKKLDRRATDVLRWEEASRQDPSFVLQVKWLPAEVDVKKIILHELQMQRVPLAPHTLAELGNLMVRKARPR